MTHIISFPWRVMAGAGSLRSARNESVCKHERAYHDRPGSLKWTQAGQIWEELLESIGHIMTKDHLCYLSDTGMS